MWIYRPKVKICAHLFFYPAFLSKLIKWLLLEVREMAKRENPSLCFLWGPFRRRRKILGYLTASRKTRFSLEKKEKSKKIPVSEQKLSARLIVVFHFYCCCFFRGGDGEVVASILTGVHTYVRMVHVHMSKCKLSILSTHWNITTTAVYFSERGNSF